MSREDNKAKEKATKPKTRVKEKRKPQDNKAQPKVKGKSQSNLPENAAYLTAKTKEAMLRSKDTIRDLSDDGQITPEEYAEEHIKNTSENVLYDAKHLAKGSIRKASDLRKKKAKRAAEKAEKNGAKNSVRTVDRTIKTLKRDIKTKDSLRKSEETAKKATNVFRKTSTKSAKTAEKTTKAVAKTAEKTAKTSKKAAEVAAKAAKKSAEAAREAAIKAYRGAVAAAKATAAAVKAIAAGISKLFVAIGAGGGIAVIVILIICVLGLIVGSCFGIFFSGEDTGNGMSMRTAMADINKEYNEKLTDIRNKNAYDVLEMSGSRAVWPDVLAVYAVKTASDPDNPQEIASMNQRKQRILSEIFWKMNVISNRAERKTETVITETDDGHGHIVREESKVTRTYLYITVSHKSADEMASQYHFTDKQKSQLSELRTPDKQKLWSQVLYGYGAGNEDIVVIARSQIGNVGGDPYWSWYGFGSHVEWCACFVSWCANEAGYIDIGVIPKYAGCGIGKNWFEQRGQWQDKTYSPNPGDIIFFDWDSPNGLSGPQDGLADHTGIVEKVENGIVYTIEGNRSDSCKTWQYPVGYYEILGYGVPAY